MERPVFKDLDMPMRILLGPGPSMVSPRVLRAMATPPIGHLDPQFLDLMAEEQQLLRYLFQTDNPLTLTIPGTGSAGMEAALSNLIEPGDAVLIPVIGFFGARLCEMAARDGAQVDRLEAPWGEVCDPSEIISALSRKKYKLMALVHAETSTGALQPNIPEISAAAHQHGALVVLDTVTSLGGIRVDIDAWDVDIAYSAAQKCLSCPPGLAPITVSPRARQAISERRTPVTNWYLDLTLLENYWEAPHAYHHTAPSNLHYGLREGLRMVAEEGLEARIARHQTYAELLWQGLEGMDLPPLVAPPHRLTTLITPQLPPGLDEIALRRRLLDDYNIEVAGGFGPLKGKVWRIGLMGFSSRRENVVLLLAAMEQILHQS
jgi:alanine-glyoxylate transaminase/serine-glyoxylate transaminase/serine-pyruvate transaminase